MPRGQRLPDVRHDKAPATWPKARGHPGQFASDYIATVQFAQLGHPLDWLTVSTPPSAPGPWVEQWLSGPRFNTYLAAGGGDRQRALDLYEWNVAVAAAIQHDLAHLEVAIRNTYDAALVARQAGPLHWTEDPLAYFPVTIRRANNGQRYDENERPRDQLAAARRSAGRTAPTGKIVAELMFGFWRYLTITGRANTLWMPYLRHGFVSGTSRPAIDDPMGRLHRLRNRVAHHEPLLTQKLAAPRGDVLTLLGHISPDLRTYVDARSSWARIEAQRP